MSALGSVDAADRRCFYYFFVAVIVIRHETTATARWTSPFIVRAFFNHTITVAVWTGFHARLTRMLPHPSNGRAAMGGMMQMAVLFASALPPKSGLHFRNPDFIESLGAQSAKGSPFLSSELQHCRRPVGLSR